MRVLITGHRGYIGSVMSCVLRNARFEVVGLDCDFFRGCDFGRIDESIPSFDCDLREIEYGDLLSFDAVIHLAGLSDDAQGDLDPLLTDQINVEATLRLAQLCKRAGVTRFLFASSCSVYGVGSCELFNEDSVTRPLSNYAASKLACERELARMADRQFSPVFLRNATVYGISPRLRTDLVVNDFVGSTITTGRIKMKSAGQATRPLIHVEDVARTYATVLLADTKTIHSQTFNVARCGENYRIIDVADEVSELTPFGTREAAMEVFDHRSYAVDDTKLRHAFPSLHMRWTLCQGIRQLANAMTSAGMTAGEWRSDRYRRILRLQRLMESGAVDEQLRQRTLTYA